MQLCYFAGHSSGTLVVPWLKPAVLLVQVVRCVVRVPLTGLSSDVVSPSPCLVYLTLNNPEELSVALRSSDEAHLRGRPSLDNR